MKITPEIKSILVKYGIRNQTFHRRIRHGWPVEKAMTTPPIINSPAYIVSNGQQKTIIHGCAGVASYLSFKTRTTVTKNTIVGQMYRKGFAKIDKYLITKK